MKNPENTVDKKRVLVVDDSRTQLEMLKYLLENEGFDVTSFNNGPEALLALEKQVPDLIITDVIMPGMDGYELCRRIKSTPAVSSVPVILLTALSGPEDVIMALQCGASTFVTKPYDAVSLSTTIKYLFANRYLGSRLNGNHEMEVLLNGRKFALSPSNPQMLDFLISTYETAVEQGHKLSQSHTALQELNDQLEQKMEELVELAAELKRTALAKSEFLSNMSHELRTPLNSINGFSEVLYDETFGPLNEKQKQYVNNVLTSGKHLLLLVNQILDMAKVEAGKMKLTLSSLSMKTLLNDISMLLADMVSKKKIEMSLEIADDLPNIEADELKVKEILYNLLSNAVKYTPEGGKIGMRVKNTGPEIEVVIWDTAVGIAPENMEKIFEGFFRVDTPYSRVTEGTGLGLPLSRKLVELHGGKLSVESEGLNKGTSVRFTLPIISRKVV